MIPSAPETVHSCTCTASVALGSAFLFGCAMFAALSYWFNRSTIRDNARLLVVIKDSNKLNKLVLAELERYAEALDAET